jgi:hypothetical protein
MIATVMWLKDKIGKEDNNNMQQRNILGQSISPGFNVKNGGQTDSFFFSWIPNFPEEIHAEVDDAACVICLYSYNIYCIA